MTTLRLLLSDQWPDQAEAHWVLLDKDHISAQGTGGPSAWPPSQRTEIVLTGSQISWINVQLPAAKPRDQLRALPFAMEEHLLREPDSQHFTPLIQNGQDWAVLVIARERLKRLTAQFTALQRPLDAAYALLAQLPTAPDSWFIFNDGQHWLIRTNNAQALLDDVPTSSTLPPIFHTAWQAVQHTAAPPTLHLAGIDKTTRESLQQALKDIPSTNTTDWAWYQTATTPSLLHGEFTAAHAKNALLRKLRPVAIFLATIFGLHLFLGVGSALLQQSELKTQRERMRELAKTQLPGQALQDPARQLTRALNRERQLHGQLGEQDALTLMAELARALGSDATRSLDNLHYENGALTVTLARPIDQAALQTQLATRGLLCTVRGNNTLIIQAKN